MKQKILAFMPGDDVKLHFKCTKTTVLKIDIIEIDNPVTDNNFIEFEL